MYLLFILIPKSLICILKIENLKIEFVRFIERLNLLFNKILKSSYRWETLYALTNH